MDNFRRYYADGTYTDHGYAPDWTNETVAIANLTFLADGGDAYLALVSDLTDDEFGA